MRGVCVVIGDICALGMVLWIVMLNGLGFLYILALVYIPDSCLRYDAGDSVSKLIYLTGTGLAEAFKPHYS